MSTLRVNTLETVDGLFSIPVNKIPTSSGPGGQLSAGNNLADLGNRVLGYNNLQYQSPMAGAIARSASAKASDVLSVKDFGAQGNGVTDDTAAINSCIVAAQNIGGATVHLPAGTYLISTALTITANGITLMGDGEVVTLIKTSSTTANMIEIGDGTTNPGYVTICSLNLSSPAVRSAGAAILVRNAHYTVIEKVSIGDTATHMFNGIDFRNGAGTLQFEYHLRQFEINACSGAGITIGSTGGQVADVFINGGVIASCGRGIDLYNVSGLCVHQVDVISSVHDAVRAFPGSGQIVEACLFNQVLADTAAAVGFSLTNNGGNVVEITLSNCWSATNGTDGIYVGDRCFGILINACRIINNGSHGVEIANTSVGAGVTVDACHILYNGQTTNNTYSGVAVGANAARFAVRNCMIGKGGIFESASLTCKQKYGVVVATGSSDGYVITGNQFVSNVTGGVSDGGSGSNKAVANNITM